MPDALPIQAVHHISHVTSQLETTRAFYQNVLGFQPIQRPNFTFDGAWLFAYGVQVHLIATGRGGEIDVADISTRADHIAFLVDDIDEARSRLESHGIPYHESRVAQTGVTQLFFRDPDGNHLELGCYPPPIPVTESDRSDS